MKSLLPYRRGCELLCLLVVASSLVGCGTLRDQKIVPAAELPRELRKTTQPEYTVEPPDILEIDLINAIPKAPYRIKPLDVIIVRVSNSLPDNPISGPFQVETDGSLRFGEPYDATRMPKVAGMTLDEAKNEIRDALSKAIKKPEVNVTLGSTRGAQQVRGPHLVRPDGTINLGTYGSVWVTGMTLTEVKAKVETHLATYFETPEVTLDVTGYNSKVYYLIYDGGGAGQQIQRLPITGNETVLDAVSQSFGLQAVSDKRKIWIARPTEDRCQCQNLPVDWKAITECGDVSTNYQLMPGDRIFVNSFRVTRIETALNRVLAPVERVFGFTLLGTGLVRTLSSSQSQNGGLDNVNNGILR